MKMSDWFPGEIKPARPGLYQRNWDSEGGVSWCWWNGNHWGLSYSLRDPDAKSLAIKYGCSAEALQDPFPWRGVVKE